MKNIRVLMLTTSYLRFGGDFSLHHEWAKIAAKKGAEITVVSPQDSSRNSLCHETIDGIGLRRFRYFWPHSLQRLAYSKGGIPANLRRNPLMLLQIPFFGISFFLSALAEAGNADLIDCQFIESGLIGLALKRIFRKPLVTTVHRLVSSSWLDRLLGRIVLSGSDIVVFNSTYTLNEARRLLPEADWRIINPSLDTSEFRPMKRSGNMRRRFCIPKNSKIVLSVGKLVEKKGIRHLITAMSLIQDKNIALVIVGWGVEEERLRAQAKELGLLGGRVFFAGLIDNKELPKWIADCDVFAVPSITDSHGEIETFGLVAAEASACGKPVIASRLGGLVDIVENGKTGFLFEPGNENELTRCIALLCNDCAKAKIFGAAARKKALNSFSTGITAKKYLDTYKCALREKNERELQSERRLP